MPAAPNPCPDETEVSELLEGRLSEAAKTRLLTHAADCDACRELLAQLSQEDSEASGPRSESEPPDGSTWLRRYRLLHTVGAGGMGVVYAAYDRELDRRVALKMLRDPGDDADGARRRGLVREARAMAKLDHPHVVRVFDVGEEGERAFVTMEFAEDGTLRGFLDVKPRSFGEIAKLFDDAGLGLQAAHEAGLIHRDFKPENVLLRGGVAKVTDFGLARRASAADDASGKGLAPEMPLVDMGTVTATYAKGAAGTLRYMAPEQLRGEALDARADLFAYAVAFWEACYGGRPFEGQTVGEVLANIEKGPVTPSGSGRGVPRRVRRALQRALAFDREARPASMRALLTEWRPLPPLGWGARLGIAAAIALVVAGAVTSARTPLRSAVEAPAVAPPSALAPEAASMAAVPSRSTTAVAAATPPAEHMATEVARKTLYSPPRTSESARATAATSNSDATVGSPSASARGPGGVFVKPPY